jgi:predicted nucleic acid-binding protein
VSVLVVDASAAIALILDEPTAREIRRILDGHRDELLVPEFFWLEVVNSLLRRHHWSSAEVLEALRELEEFGITTVETDRLGRFLMVDYAERFLLSAYDAVYVALAGTADAQILTSDRALASAAGSRAIYVDAEGRISEPPAAYEVTPTWPTWRGAASYLGQLRLRATETETDAGAP